MVDSLVLQAVGISLSVAVASCAVSFAPGLFVGLLLARGEFRGRAALQAVVMFPLVLPPVVTGYLLLIAFSPRGWLGAFLDNALGIRLAFSWGGAVVAAAVVGFPLLVQQVRNSIEAVDPRYEVVSRSLGRTPWESFWRVTFPLARPGVAGGLLLAFARSLGEFGATITLAGLIPGETNTIALTIFQQLQSPSGERTVVLLAGISVVIALGALVIFETLNRRHRARLQWNRGTDA